VVADRAAAAVARGQHTAITFAQLVAVGHTRASIRHRVASGWMRRQHRGVYLLGAVDPPLARAMAAVLALGDGALLSHHPAAVLFGLRPSPAQEMHVTVVKRNASGPPGVMVHRLCHLHPSDITRRHGIPTTSPARTLLDLATQVSQRDLDRAVNEARVQRLVSELSLNAQFARYPHHRGTLALKRATLDEPKLTRSEAERRLLELIRAARLPEPETNVMLHGHEADMLWRDLHLVVEIDSFQFHSTRAAFERDRRRDAKLQTAGYRVIRVTWRQITDHAAEVVATLARASASAVKA